MKKFPWNNLIFAALLLAYGLYAYKFIQRTSFMIDGTRYYALFDDAMISMRYAKNLAAGLGPVWNPGERVEGFTNPLWVGFMALAHLLPLAASKVSAVIQAAGAIILAINLFVVKKIADETTPDAGSPALLALLAVFLTAFYYSLNVWTLEGMEVGLLTLLISLALWLALRGLRRGTFSPWLYVLLGVATWVRMDAAVAYLAVWLFLLVFDSAHRKRHLRWGGGLFLGFLIVQTGLRLAYFGEWLPNTYTLKMEGYGLVDRVKRGLKVYLQFAWNMNWVLFLIPFTLLALKRDRATGLLLFLFVAQSAYSISVGGDAWEHKGGANRFITTAMPGFFVLFAYALEKLRQAVVRHLRREKSGWNTVAQAALIPFVVASLFSFNTLLEQDSVAKWTLTKRPIFVTGNEKHVQMGLLVERLTTADARVAVVSAGAISYFSGRYAIDLLGKADKVIAHMQPRPLSGISDDEDFRPGHNKWDYAYSIGQLKPDLVVQLWSNPEEARPFLDAGYVLIKVDEYPMYFLADSPNIRWDAIP